MPDVIDINKLLKDSAYAAIGFGVLGFQKAQVRRHEMAEQVSAQGSQLADLGQRLEIQLNEVARLVERQMQPVRRQLDDRLSEVEDFLPAPTRNVIRSLRSAATSQEQALRSAVGLDA